MGGESPLVSEAAELRRQIAAVRHEKEDLLRETADYGNQLAALADLSSISRKLAVMRVKYAKEKVLAPFSSVYGARVRAKDAFGVRRVVTFSLYSRAHAHRS